LYGRAGDERCRVGGQVQVFQAVKLHSGCWSTSPCSSISRTQTSLLAERPCHATVWTPASSASTGRHHCSHEMTVLRPHGKPRKTSRALSQLSHVAADRFGP